MHYNQDCRSWCPRAQRVGRFSPTYDDCPSIHAEANALLKMDREQGKGGAIYTTSDVCMGCAKLIANSGLKKVIVKQDITENTSHRQPNAVYDFLRYCGVEVFVVTG